MSDFFATLCVVLLILILWLPIVLFAIKIKNTKGNFNTQAIILCIFSVLFSGPIGLFIILIIINKYSDVFIKGITNSQQNNEKIVFNPNSPYLEKLLNTAILFMQEYLYSGVDRVFTLLICVDYVSDSFFTDEYIKVKVILNDWYPYVITDKRVLKSFTDYFKYDTTKEIFYSEGILARMRSRGEETTSLTHLIQDFAVRYEEKHPYIKFRKTSYGVELSKTGDEYIKEKDKYPLEQKRKHIDHYFNHPKTAKMIEYIKEGGEPYKIIVNYDCLEIYYPNETRKFDFLANKINNFKKIVSCNFKSNTSSIYYLGEAINKHFHCIYSVEEKIKVFETVSNANKKDFGTELLNVELKVFTENIES